ncbi:MAG TPA: helix-turn-helix domain-containing protein [Pseudonocardia sp.]
MPARHPDRDQIVLEDVLVALGHPIRLRIVEALGALPPGGEQACGSILGDNSVGKSTLTHHWRVLRDSGVINQRPSGRENQLSLRRADLDARFPGFLDTVLNAVAAQHGTSP